MNFDALNRTPDRVRYVTVSEMQDFLRCTWRWYAKWVLNRVPRKWSPALILGTAVHDIFEGHFGHKQPLDREHAFQVARLEERLRSTVDPDEVLAVAKALKELKQYYAQIVGFVDKFPGETLEVEHAFEMHLYTPTFTWQSEPMSPRSWVLRGRPDRVIRVGDLVYHMQHKTVAKGKSPHLYATVLQRSMHEGLYGYYLARKYNGDRQYGGTIVNLIRKAAPKATDSLEAYAFQVMVSVDEVDRERAMLRARAIAAEMDRAEHFGRTKGIHALIDNPQEDDGYFHNSLDGYFPVLQGKARLDDDRLFMPREETYGAVEAD